MDNEKKTVAKRIFVSNTFMTLVILLIFLIVNVGFLKIYEHSYREKNSSLYELDENINRVKELLTEFKVSANERDYTKLAEQLKEIEYFIYITNENGIITTNSSSNQDKAFNYLKHFKIADGKVHVYFTNNMSILSLYYKDNDIALFAVNGEYKDFKLAENSFTSFIILFLIDGLICITLLLFICKLFTKNLIKHVIKPLNALSEGANRMRKGILDIPISYSGDIEFEDLCNAFDEMQEHLLQGKKKSEIYEKARTDMISGISHDLRTPLTAIRGTVKGLIDGISNTPEKQKSFLEIAYRRTMDIDLLLQQLFYFSKLQTGNMPFFMIKTDIVKYILEYVKRFEEISAEKGIEFKVNCEIQEIYANIDIDQTKRVFDNLIENSIKYSGSEHLLINISIIKKNGNIVINVVDNGKGITTEKLPFIFEQFYRGDESRNINDGNGLGLYIVRYIIEAMGGNVCADNNNGLQISIAIPEAKEENK